MIRPALYSAWLGVDPVLEQAEGRIDGNYEKL